MRNDTIQFTSLASNSVVKGSELTFKSIAKSEKATEVKALASIVFASIASK